MRSKMILRMVGVLLVCLLAGSIFSGALAAGPPPGPPPPEPKPPPEPVHPRILIPIPPELDDGLRRIIKLPPELAATPVNRIPSVSKDFDTFINPEWRGIGIKIDLLRKGAYIGMVRALVPFCICDKTEGKFKGDFPTGDYYIWMMHVMTLGIKIPSEFIDMNWFIVLVGSWPKPIPNFEPPIKAILYYPEIKYRSPEEMLKAARSQEDGGYFDKTPKNRLPCTS